MIERQFGLLRIRVMTSILRSINSMIHQMHEQRKKVEQNCANLRNHFLLLPLEQKSANKTAIINGCTNVLLQ